MKKETLTSLEKKERKLYKDITSIRNTISKIKIDREFPIIKK